jgi:hypothetical protein
LYRSIYSLAMVEPDLKVMAVLSSTRFRVFLWR